MSTPFSQNLRLVLKMLSMSTAELTAELGTDKSVVSRWLNGNVQPSAHNLSRLSALVAARVNGFTVLDWERDPRSLAGLFGADPNAIPSMQLAPSSGLPLPNWGQMLATTSTRGEAYEGFFRSTRPHSSMPGRFLHDFGMIRRDAAGLLCVAMGASGSVVDGWLIPLHGLLYIIVANPKSGTMLFGMFNDPPASRLDVFEGLVLIPGLDLGRAPTATAMYCERIGVLSGDRDADDRRFAELSSQDHLAPEGSVDQHIASHLVRDFGPEQLARGGDLLLKSPLTRSLGGEHNYPMSSAMRHSANGEKRQQGSHVAQPPSTESRAPTKRQPGKDSAKL
jgi:transcriptional regulator with XRE-family HTH domain